MGILEDFVNAIDYTLNSRRRRHILGGALLSVSALFAGLALTAMTLKSEVEYDVQG